MSVNNFKPEIWSKVILAALQKKLVYGCPMVVNNDYDGEISGPGNAVHITQFGDPTITTTRRARPSPTRRSIDAGMTLYIDQANSFSFAIDDVDRRQAAGDMQAYLEGRAAYQLANIADQYIAALYTGVARGERPRHARRAADAADLSYGGSRHGQHPADSYVQVLEPLKVILDQNNVPDDDRYIICPPWVVSLISQTQAFVSVTDMQGDPSQTFQRGFMGQVSGFNILKSNNVPSARRGRGRAGYRRLGDPGRAPDGNDLRRADHARPRPCGSRPRSPTVSAACTSTARR